MDVFTDHVLEPIEHVNEPGRIYIIYILKINTKRKFEDFKKDNYQSLKFRTNSIVFYWISTPYEFKLRY